LKIIFRVAQFSKIIFFVAFVGLYLCQKVAKFEGGNFRFKEDIYLALKKLILQGLPGYRTKTTPPVVARH